MGERLRVLTVLGTRPEIIKLAPVIRLLAGRPDAFESLVCATGQHAQLAELALPAFGIEPDYRLRPTRASGDLAALTAKILSGLDDVLASSQPDVVLVQGDTTSALCGALAASYRGLRVGHVEAGLRTGDPAAPFPEEINRSLIARLAHLHFAPTDAARACLLVEGVDGDSVHVTGNTGIDTLLQVLASMDAAPPAGLSSKRWAALADHPLVLVTCHRRESHGATLRSICAGIRQAARRHPEARFLWPLHPNPAVGGAARELLGQVAGVELLAPLPYASFVWLMARSTLVVTDSGGVQEEAPALGKPVLVLRERTERQEGIDAGTARLVGTGAANIALEISRLLTDPAARRAMARRHTPYGDGRAAERIVAILAGHLPQFAAARPRPSPCRLD